MEDAKTWARRQFGRLDLGDQRLTRRAVQLAQAMARLPSGSIGQQTRAWKAQRAAYRLLDNDAVTHENLSIQHWQQTRAKSAVAGETVLMVQDITMLDYTGHPNTEGLGPIGNHRGQGLMVHNTLAVNPSTRAVEGMAYQQVWVRPETAPVELETSTTRKHRPDRQSHYWVKAVREIGTPPDATRWVHVGDRESDIFEFFAQTVESQCDFCVRVVQNRRLQAAEKQTHNALLTHGRDLPSMSQRLLEIPAKPRRAARLAVLSLSWSPVQVRAPVHGQYDLPHIEAWVVRAWEEHPPVGVDALEWVLLTSVPVLSSDDAQERLDWYTCRWIIEVYHSCLKTGCGVEHSQLHHADRLSRLLAFLSILAVRLLQLRDAARATPDTLALRLVQPVLVQIVAYKIKANPNTLTCARFWTAVAVMGGFPARKSDGQPGWKRLWAGWLHLLTLADGVHLARGVPPLSDVGNP